MSNKKSGISRKSGAKNQKRKGKGGKTGQVWAALILVSLCVFAAVWLWSTLGQAPSSAPSAPSARSGMQMPGAGPSADGMGKVSGKDKASDKGKASSKKQAKGKGKVSGSTASADKTSASKKKQAKDKDKVSGKDKTSTKASGKKASARGVYTLSGANAEEEFWPEFDYDCTSQILRHTGCVISYNADYKVPNWVLYELTFAETLGNIDRGNFDFDTDPDVPARQMAQLTDYRRSGYSRGHMAPAADLKWSVTSMAQSFYLTNVCPQDSKLNTGTWKKLETKIRDWAERDSAITVVCGPILPRTAAEKRAMTTIGKGQVLVPEYFYKIVFAPFAPEPKAIGFIMPNHKCHTDLKRYVVTVDSIEARTGIDFFPVLPDDIEARVESQSDTKFWFRAK